MLPTRNIEAGVRASKVCLRRKDKLTGSYVFPPENPRSSKWIGDLRCALLETLTIRGVWVGEADSMTFLNTREVNRKCCEESG